MVCRHLLFTAAQDDLALIRRPLFEALEGILPPVSEVATQVHATINLQAALPPTSSYMPGVSRLATHVNDLSVREFRRSKLEMLVLPTLDLWFRRSLLVDNLPSAPTDDDPDVLNEASKQSYRFERHKTYFCGISCDGSRRKRSQYDDGITITGCEP